MIYGKDLPMYGCDGKGGNSNSSQRAFLYLRSVFIYLFIDLLLDILYFAFTPSHPYPVPQSPLLRI